MAAKGATLTVNASQEKALLHPLRPRHWAKNGFIAAPIFFTPIALFVAAVCRVAAGILWFYALSSAVYFLNDYVCRLGVNPTVLVIVCTGLLAPFSALSKQCVDVANGFGGPIRQSFQTLELVSPHRHIDRAARAWNVTTFGQGIYG